MAPHPSPAQGGRYLDTRLLLSLSKNRQDKPATFGCPTARRSSSHKWEGFGGEVRGGVSWRQIGGRGGWVSESGFRSQTLFSVDSSPLAEEKKTTHTYNKKRLMFPKELWFNWTSLGRYLSISPINNCEKRDALTCVRRFALSLSLSGFVVVYKDLLLFLCLLFDLLFVFQHQTKKYLRVNGALSYWGWWQVEHHKSIQWWMCPLGLFVNLCVCVCAFRRHSIIWVAIFIK